MKDECKNKVLTCCGPVVGLLVQSVSYKVVMVKKVSTYCRCDACTTEICWGDTCKSETSGG